MLTPELVMTTDNDIDDGGGYCYDDNDGATLMMDRGQCDDVLMLLA